MVPSTLETFGFDTYLNCFLLFEQVEGYVAQQGEVMGRVVGTGAVVVFSESYVQYPV